MAIQLSGESQPRKCVLIVDDEALNRDILQEHLSDEGYRILQAEDGVEGMKVLEEKYDEIDVILLDRMMPNMNGMEFYNRMSNIRKMRDIPVIMQTAAASKNEVVEGIAAGVFYYLTKPYDAEVMLSIVRSAIEDYEGKKNLVSQMEERTSAIGYIEAGLFLLSRPDEARNLSSMLALACPNSHAAVNAMMELMLNGIEHGNLGISYARKSELIGSGEYHQEIERLLALEENKKKKIQVRFERRPGQIRFMVEDEGKGFDWQQYVNFDPSRATDTHGRGIMTAQMAFAKIHYEGCGNVVVGSIPVDENGQMIETSSAAEQHASAMGS